MTIHQKAAVVSTFPAAFGAIAIVLFEAQGGFGAGHGVFDRAIVLLGLPATIVSPFFALNDLLGFIVLPTVLNVIAWFAAGSAVLHYRQHRQTS